MMARNGCKKQRRKMKKNLKKKIDTSIKELCIDLTEEFNKYSEHTRIWNI